MRQKIRCKCGKNFAACTDGFQDDEWNLETGRYVAKGCTSELCDKPTKLEQCTCPNMDGSLKNQIEMDLH